MSVQGRPSAVRVFVLDDHDVIQRGFRGLIDSGSDLVLVGSATTAAEALVQVPELRPDLVVVDVNLPDGNGVQVCRALRSAMPQLRCLMITAGSQEDAQFAALLAGATGFITKHSGAEEILAAVRRAAGNRDGMDRSGSAELLEHHAVDGAADPSAPRHLIAADELARLTARQRQILELVLGGRTNPEIAGRLSLAESTIASQISVLFTTLGLRRRLSDAFDEASRIPREP